MIKSNQELPEEEVGMPKADQGPDASKQTPPITSATTVDTPAFGWSAYAERVNGRFAMIGFTSVLLIEALTNETFLHWAGLAR